MKTCPQCEAGYPDELTTCPVHRDLLSEIRDLKPGMLIRGTYRIQRKLNRGGMGEVYLARHILLDEQQVLKFLSKTLSDEPEWTDRFLREVRALRQIRHKNVIAAGNLEPAEDGTLFFTMEFVDGPDLMEFYRQAPKPFDVALALTLIRGIAEGLGAAHAAGVVHRDIKAENILIAHERDELVPKIADFGIVATQDVTRLTLSGMTLLTPQFAAPEQWLGKPTTELDGRTDFYALGGLLFELLTGQSAILKGESQDWASLHLNAFPRVPSSLRPELACWDGLDDFVLRLLAKDPNDRPRNVRDLLRLLTQISYAPPERMRMTPEPLRLPPQEVLREIPISAALEPAKPPDEAIAHAAIVEPAADHAGEAAAEVSGQRRRTKLEPMPIWEPFQPRSAEKPRPAAARTETQKPQTRHYGLHLLAVVVAVLAVVLGIETMLNPLHSQVLARQHGAIVAIAFNPDGLNVASASRDGTVQIWNVSDGRPLGTLAANTNALAYSPRGDTIATGMPDNTIDLWDASHASVLATLQGHTAAVGALVFSPDGRTLASGSLDRTVRIWDVSDGILLRTLSGSAGPVFTVAFSPDSHMVASAGAEGEIRFWDPATGILLRTLQGHTGAIRSIAFSPNGQYLASAGDDRTIRIWNVATGSLLRMLPAQAGPVLSVAFSPDGRTLASGDTDSTVKLWEMPSGRLLRTLKAHRGAVTSVAFSSFGSILASGSTDKTVRLWRIAKLHE